VHNDDQVSRGTDAARAASEEHEVWSKDVWPKGAWKRMAVSYNPADIEQARSTIGAEAGKFGAVGDAVPASVDAGMFGTLGNSGAAASAASALCAALHGEYGAAEGLVGQIERTLDSTMTSTGGTETDNKQNISNVH
jgi:hypothetical protein